MPSEGDRGSERLEHLPEVTQPVSWTWACVHSSCPAALHPAASSADFCAERRRPRRGNVDWQCQGLLCVKDGAYEDHIGARPGHSPPVPVPKPGALDQRFWKEALSPSKTVPGNAVARLFPRGFVRESLRVFLVNPFIRLLFVAPWGHGDGGGHTGTHINGHQRGMGWE